MSEFDNATALNPARSVVIEACAGSGKTWLLVSRVVRLLLAGVPPGEILAITFTRKAAQEMEARLREWLEFLALADDDAVRRFLRERAVPESELDSALPRARNLFEAFLTARPTLTVSTFHGWFLQLLQRAPLESGYAGAQALLDQTSALLEEAWQSFAEDLQDDPGGDVAQSLNRLFAGIGLAATHDLLENFVARRAEWWVYVGEREDPVGYALERLRNDWNVDPDADILSELANLSDLEGELQSYLGLLEMNTDKDKELAARLAAALAEADKPQWFKEICGVLFTDGGQGTPRSRKPSGAQAKRLGAAGEERLLSLHAFLCDRFEAARTELAAQAAYAFNRDALLCGAALLEKFQRLKTDQQGLDFADVEWRVHQLLARSDYAAAMQYKLDARYRHILLDEFQDTNPLQWQVLKSWLAASGEAGSPPTVFLVGDPKQSIYRFRRAEARLFDLAGKFLETEYGAARLSQNLSYRCAPAVVAQVNKVFAAEAGYDLFHPHDAARKELAGGVEVLPLARDEREETVPAEAPLALRNPLTTPREDTEDRRYESEAAQVAEGIRAIVGRWVVADKGKPRLADYRDVMLLVRRRTRLEAYEKALKAARIPFVSTRRGGLLDTLECRDLTALLEFLAAPFADLKLAHALRSPVFGCTDDDLIALAQRDEPTWWRRLGALAQGGEASPALARAHGLLADWLKLADTLPVHDLLDRIYFRGNLLDRYRATVPEALQGAVAANLHAFLELALAVDSGRYPSLAKFLRQIAELRRAADQEAPDEGAIGDSANAVRIHTVHEAKGLESPVVWLLDANAAPNPDRGYRVLLDWPPEESAPRHFSLYGKSDGLTPQQKKLLEDEAAIATRENLNLLYVAMTRAQQALLVSGCEVRRGGNDSWHAKLQAAAGEEAPPIAPIFETAAPVAEETTAPPITIADPRLAQTLSVGQREQAEQTPQQRFGIRLHALLEWLAPPEAVTDKAALQDRLELEHDEFEPLWQEAQAVLQAPHLQAFFDPARYRRAWNELPYRNAAGETRRIDRLVELEDAFWVLDYKTTEAVTDPARAAAPYRDQLAEYRRAVAAAFPGKPVRCALVFRGGQLHEID
ncbi:MAG: UvrD-helicase domain-containing protein [Sulfuricellaceae bacterium]|jgi:ATP-dependent helicase/nuclease subunit A